MNFRSEKINEIVAMLIKARPELLDIEQDKKGNRGKYIGRDRILSAANTILAKYDGQIIPRQKYMEGVGLILVIELTHGPSHQWISSEYSLDEQADYNRKIDLVKSCAEYIFKDMNPLDQIDIITKIVGDTNHRKGGSITYGLRYTIGAMLGISIGDDDYKPQDNKPSPVLKLTPKQVAELSDLFVGHGDLKARVFKSEGISRWEDILQEAIPDILEFYEKETGSK